VQAAKAMMALAAAATPFTEGAAPELLLGDTLADTYTYDMMNPGPLNPKIAGTFSGGQYSVGTIQNGQTLYKAGDAANPGGSFFNFKPVPKP
jgi:hypothetical protein